MNIEQINSRQNNKIKLVKKLGIDSAFRREQGLFICDGEKFLKEQQELDIVPEYIFWKEKPINPEEFPNSRQYILSVELFDYISPMKNSPGPLTVVKIPEDGECSDIKRAIALENLQDPGNVGTILRTACALGIDLVLLLGDCADLYNPKTVKASMGAILKQKVLCTDIEGLLNLSKINNLDIVGTVLHKTSISIKDTDISKSIVCIGNEGKGLSEEIVSLCDKLIIIPMEQGSESFNAGVAAAICMWEMTR